LRGSPSLFFYFYTTRPARDGEKEGVDYYFVTESVFKDGRREGVPEWAIVHGYYYGTYK
jgi:guanylate kinase